jgi:hypothetical protein
MVENQRSKDGHLLDAAPCVWNLHNVLDHAATTPDATVDIDVSGNPYNSDLPTKAYDIAAYIMRIRTNTIRHGYDKNELLSFMTLVSRDSVTLLPRWMIA